jgi:ribokinase
MITVVGSLNMDLFIDVAQLPAPGETVVGKNFRRSPGGKGANQASAIARLGHPVAMIGAVGRDAFGEELIETLAGQGVRVEAIARRDGVATGTALIVLDAAGQNQIVIAPGANGTLAAADIGGCAALLRQSRAVIAQLEIPLAATEAALRAAREAGAVAVLNPAPFVPGCDALLPICDWLLPNETEASKLAGFEVRDLNSAARAARRLREASCGLNVLVTLGSAGAWLDTEDFSGHVPALVVEAIDTVGAGDTFVGAFVTRLVEGAAPLEAARFASAAAAISVTRRGAQSGPSRAEADAFLRAGQSASLPADADGAKPGSL